MIGMPWGFKGAMSDDEFDRHQIASDKWINEMWKAYRVNLGGNQAYKPQTTRVHCESRHGHWNGDGWDKWVWRGESYREERGYCTDCGAMIPGVLSPWKEAALEAWNETRYMKNSKRDRFLERTAKSIKFGQRGKRVIVTMSSDEKTIDFIAGNRGYGNDAWFGGQR